MTKEEILNKALSDRSWTSRLTGIMTVEQRQFSTLLACMEEYAKAYHEQKMENKIKFNTLDQVSISFNGKESKDYVVIGDPLGLGTLQLKAHKLGDDLPYDIVIKSKELSKERLAEAMLKYSGVHIDKNK